MINGDPVIPMQIGIRPEQSAWALAYASVTDESDCADYARTATYTADRATPRCQEDAGIVGYIGHDVVRADNTVETCYQLHPGFLCVGSANVGGFVYRQLPAIAR
jgi:hypothetical protein